MTASDTSIVSEAFGEPKDWGEGTTRGQHSSGHFNLAPIRTLRIMYIMLNSRDVSETSDAPRHLLHKVLAQRWHLRRQLVRDHCGEIVGAVATEMSVVEGFIDLAHRRRLI